jgi:hypothetical protein
MIAPDFKTTSVLNLVDPVNTLITSQFGSKAWLDLANEIKTVEDVRN